MAADLDSMIEKFLADSNEALTINFTRNGKDVFDEPFNPAFTYPIFGEDEKIIGYDNPQITLRFREHDLKPTLRFSYDEKFQAIGETEAMDVEGMLKDFLPESAFAHAAQNGASTAGTDKTWSPPGKCVQKYTRGGKQFAIYCSSLLDTRAREILRNMRILVPLNIEGGTPCYYLDDPDWSLSRWKLFLIYELGAALDDGSFEHYSLAGFGTSYRLWIFPDRTIRAAMGEHVPSPPPSPNLNEERDQDGNYKQPYTEQPDPRQETPEPDDIKLDSEAVEQLSDSGLYSPLEAPSRERVSQFVIFPPYQRAAHGSALYDTMISMFRADKWVYEITVEDPNEEFDALRDYQDLAYLRTLPAFAGLSVKADVPAELLAPDAFVPTEHLVDGGGADALDALRHASKISPRQFARLVEMQLLASVPAANRSTSRLIRRERSAQADDRRFWFWRLLVKHRIYIKNADQLVQLDEEERGPKVAEAVDGQFREYEERLAKFEQRQKRVLAERQANGGVGGMSGDSRRKGKGKRVIEDDEDEEMEAAASGSKRSRVA